jgi:hypothetical protein
LNAEVNEIDCLDFESLKEFHVKFLVLLEILLMINHLKVVAGLNLQCFDKISGKNSNLVKCFCTTLDSKISYLQLKDS